MAYEQPKVYQALLIHGPMTTAQVQEAMGYARYDRRKNPNAKAYDLLRRLKVNGHATLEGSLWMAIRGRNVSLSNARKQVRPLESKALRLVKEEARTSTALAAEMGIHPRSAQNLLQRLKRRGEAHRIGNVWRAGPEAGHVPRKPAYERTNPNGRGRIALEECWPLRVKENSAESHAASFPA